MVIVEDEQAERGLVEVANDRAEVVDRVLVLERALADVDLKKRFDEVGLEGVGMQTDAFAKFAAQDAAAMRELARKIGLAAK